MLFPVYLNPLTDQKAIHWSNAAFLKERTGLRFLQLFDCLLCHFDQALIRNTLRLKFSKGNNAAMVYNAWIVTLVKKTRNSVEVSVVFLHYHQWRSSSPFNASISWKKSDFARSHPVKGESSLQLIKINRNIPFHNRSRIRQTTEIAP